MPTRKVRNVPEELHRTLKAKAACGGMSMSEFLVQELEMLARRPSRHEFRQRLHQREPMHLNPTAAQIIRELRDRD